MILYSVMASSSAPPSSLFHNNKGNLLTDKIILPDADEKEKEKSDIIIMTKGAPEPLTPQAFKRKGK